MFATGATDRRPGVRKGVRYGTCKGRPKRPPAPQENFEDDSGLLWHRGIRLFRRANEAMLKSLWYAYRDRRARKRDLRKLWITRINAAARINGTHLQPPDATA